MLTLEINGEYITWPEDFALLMIGHYKNHGVPFTIHRNCVHAGWSTVAQDVQPAASAERAKGRTYSGLD